MPKLYAYNTSATQVKKRYAMIGSTATQVKKRYAMIGSTATLVYSAETQIYPGASVTTRIDWGSNTISGFTATRAGYTESYAMLYIPIDLTNYTTLIIKGSAKRYAGICLRKSLPEVSNNGCLQVAHTDNYGEVWKKSIWADSSITVDEPVDVYSYTGTYYLVAAIYGSNVTVGEAQVSVTSVVGE